MVRCIPGSRHAVYQYPLSGKVLCRSIKRKRSHVKLHARRDFESGTFIALYQLLINLDLTSNTLHPQPSNAISHPAVTVLLYTRETLAPSDLPDCCALLTGLSSGLWPECTCTTSAGMSSMRLQRSLTLRNSCLDLNQLNSL